MRGIGLVDHSPETAAEMVVDAIRITSCAAWKYESKPYQLWGQRNSEDLSCKHLVTSLSESVRQKNQKTKQQKIRGLHLGK